MTMKNRIQAFFHTGFGSYLTISLVAILGALNYEIFVFPNSFAPSGLNGICTIIQHVFSFSFGYMSLMLNIPLLIIAFIGLNRGYALKNMVYILVFSVASLILGKIDFSSISFFATDGGEKVMAAIAAGFFNGFIYSATLRLGGSTGGIDILAAFFNHHHPEFSLVWIIFFINVGVAIMSFFAFGFNYAAVILCLVYAFVTSRVNDGILKGAKAAAKFEIITDNPEPLAHELMKQLKHGCTLVQAKGMYSNSDKKLLICVVNKLQIADFERVMRNHKDCFVIVSSVNSTYGNFKHIK